MKAMVLNAAGSPLVEETRPDPVPGPGELQIRVEACAICRTDLHVIDGELPDLQYPRVPGHEVVGRVDLIGMDVAPELLARRVGLGWLGHTCGHCPYCRSLRENLCDTPEFTGYTRDGGFATHVIADAANVFPLDEFPDPVAAAPLMCAGLIGWHSLRSAGAARRVGLYGFGAVALTSSRRSVVGRGARSMPLRARAMRRPRPMRYRSVPAGRVVPRKSRRCHSTPR